MRNGGHVIARYRIVVLGVIAAGTLISVPYEYQAAHAAQLSASLVPEFDQGTATLSAVTFIQLQYPLDSSVAKSFAGMDKRIEFFVNGTSDPANTRGLISQINKSLLERGSPVMVRSLNLHYSGVIRGQADGADIALSVDLMPDLSGFVLSNDRGSGQITIDMNWRGLVLGNSSEIKTKYGVIDVNSPAGLLGAAVPKVASEMLSSGEAKQLLSTPILDFTDIGKADLTTWHSLFDPTRLLATKINSTDFRGMGSARVLSVYALGECSLKQLCTEHAERTATANIDGSPVIIRLKTPLPDAQIQVAGYSTPEQVGNAQVLYVTLRDRPVGPTDAFPLQVLVVFGGMMGAIAAFVLVKSRK